MGRWTPLVLMAGGLAILLGTLLGINFPMGRQTAQNPANNNRSSSVLPANINVNSSGSGSESATQGSRVAQSNANTQGGNSSAQTGTTTAQANGNNAQSSTGQTQAQAGSGSTTVEPAQPATSGERPIRALW